MDSSHRHASAAHLIFNFKSDCPLCKVAAEPQGQADFVCELKHVVVTRGPFAKRWPGALQVTAKRHLKDPSQLKYPHFIHTQSELYQLEMAVRRKTHAKHMNVVKFGNVVEHLHWHLIPRFNNETHPQKTPWELSEIPDGELFHTQYTGSRDDLYAEILTELSTIQRNLQPSFFATAFFIRPKNVGSQPEFLKKSLTIQHQLIRAQPAEFECFLMQRNYFDFAWDTFGGEGDPGENPSAALKREVHEELGWTASDLLEVTRQWDSGILRGFCYLVMPSQGQLLQAEPQRVLCDEVKQAAWIPLEDIVSNKDGLFSAQLSGRARALVAGEPDFYL